MRTGETLPSMLVYGQSYFAMFYAQYEALLPTVPHIAARRSRVASRELPGCVSRTPTADNNSHNSGLCEAITAFQPPKSNCSVDGTMPFQPFVY